VCWGGGSGEAAFEFALRLVGFEGAVLLGFFGEEARLACADGDFKAGELVGAGGCAGEEFGEGVERTDVVGVGVGEEDAADGSAEGLGGLEKFDGGAEGGVDECEAVGLKDEVGVHEAELGELVGVG
jgi:hypothetical protein